MKTIGILGGMGPEATADLYMSIVRIFQLEYGAKYDRDFPSMFIYSLPIPDVVEKLEAEQATVSALIAGGKKLENAGADFIGIPCNSVQAYVPQMRKAVKIPIISIPEEAAILIKTKGYKKVGLLATETTIKSNVFEKYCSDIKIIKPCYLNQIEITKIIMNILSGKKLRKDRQKLDNIIKFMKSDGAEAVIVACTDLPLILKQKDSQLPLLNTTEILAQAAVRECMQNLFKPNQQGK